MVFPLTTTKALQLYQIARQAAGILTGVVLAKTGLSTAEIGSFEVLLYIGTSVSFFWVNGLLQGMVPVHTALDEKDQKPFIFNVFLVFLGISVGIWLLLFFLKPYAIPLLTGMDEVPYYGLFITYLLLNLPTYPIEIFYLIKDKPKAIVWWAILTFGLHLAVLAVPLFLGFGLETAFMALIGFTALRCLWSLFCAIDYGEVVWRWDLIRTYVLFSSPLIVNAVIGHLGPLFDNWMVGQWYQDKSTFAIFRYGAREFPLALAMATALATSAVLPLSEAWKKGGLREALPGFKRKTTKLMHLVFPLSILTMLLSHWAFPLVFNTDFKESAGIFNVFLLLVGSRLLMPNTLILATQRPQVLFWISLGELFLKIALAYCFIQIWGLIGLAFSSVVAYFFEKIISAAYLLFKENIQVNEWISLPWYLFYLSLLFGAYCITAH